jgi:membrane protein DedA with SNARE-associated domain
MRETPPVGGVLDHVLNLNQGWLYLIVGSLVFAEYALFFGFVLPGETAAVLAGVQAQRGAAHLSAVLAIVVVAGIVGAWVGFEVGRRYGSRLLEVRLLKGHERRIAQAMDMLARRGGAAVFLGRFVAFFRPVMPALAGVARMHYPKFLAFNAIGGIVWGVLFVSAGYIAGDSYRRVEHVVGKATAVVVATVVVIGLVILSIRKHRSEEG